MNDRPQLRALDIFPVKVKGETAFAIRDPEGVAAEVFVMNGPTLLLASLMNGRRTLPEILAEFAARAGGLPLKPQDLEGLVGQMDERLLLAGGRYAERVEAIEKEFAGATVRPASNAGGAYPDGPAEVTKALDGYYRSEQGFGRLPEGGEGSRVRGIIAPHIDYGRGGFCYTHAYAAMAGTKATTFVILGVAHCSPPVPFVVTDKAFATPLGEAAPAADVLEALRKRAPKECFTHQAVHRTEHSIELQVVFLQHLLKRPFRVVPVLCSAFEPIAGEEKPSACARIEDFVGALREAADGRGEDVVFVSGADLAHIGPRFGDDRPLTKEFVAWMEEEDLKSLERVQRGDAEGWYHSVVRDGNARKVCGLSSIYTFLRMMDGAKGEVKRYGYAPDPAGGVVSFASVVCAAEPPPAGGGPARPGRGASS